MTKYILYLLLILAILLPPVSAANFTTNMNFDITTGVYTKYTFGNMILTGNISISDLMYGSYKPIGDGFVNMTGLEEAWWIPFLIIYMLILLALCLQYDSTIVSLMVLIMTASGAATLIPTYGYGIFTMIAAMGLAAVGWKLYTDR